MFCLISTSAHAAFDVMEFIKQRSSQRKTEAWTLSDWLANKQKVKLMDQWLAANRSSQFFGFSFGGTYAKYDLQTSASTTTGDIRSKNGNLKMQFGFLEIAGSYEDSTETSTAYGYQLGLRLLGQSMQSTRLSTYYGIKSFEDKTLNEKFNSPYVGADIDIYVFQHFGLTSKYQSFLTTKSNLDRELKASKIASGIFIESGFIRILGLWTKEAKKISSASAQEESQDRSGFEVGAQLYF